ncbi:hypothetical protein [uncultured Solobacterium sp.]|uniref:AAA family ATPase n=1 Tax=uncultured Solobacterium sp. TaxID=747375 RepID=UPI0028DC58AB|nr:hypothetical protein [uncultured Solobacterium sp.]
MISNEEIIEWAVKQHCWVSDAIKTFYEKGGFEENDIERFVEECICEQEGKGTRVDLTGLNLLQHGEQGCLAICAINNVEGVNALKTGQSLKFSPEGITVVYGDNGAGKSGYIRIIKQISNARYKEDIKGNVYRKTKPSKKCQISINYNNEEKELPCNLDNAGEYKVLRNIDVFDTKISKAYVETAKEASYEPWIFSMFSAIANITTVIKAKIEEKKKLKPLNEINIPEELMELPGIKILTDYTYKTKINENNYSWEDTDEAELQKLVKQSNEDTVTAQIKQLSGSISSIQMLITELEKYKIFYNPENIGQIGKLKERWKLAVDKKNAATLLFQSQASEIDKESIGNDAWISLWQSAKKYYEDVLIKKKEVKYDIDGGKCPLCRQKIQGHLIQRIQSIEDYLNGTTSEEEKTSRELYISEFGRFVPCWSEDTAEQNLNSCDIQNIRDEIKIIFRIIRNDYSLISQEKYEEVDLKPFGIENIINNLIDIKSRRISEQESKIKLLTDDAHIELMGKIKELQAKKLLNLNKDILASNIDILKYYKGIEKAASYSNSQSITKKSNEIANELLSEEYIKRFNSELSKLTKRLVHVTLKQQRGGKGKIPFKVELVDIEGEKVSPVDILSEGENRVVSLAAFFAEAFGRNERCPLIVDDPISSLDYSYEDSVILRLVEAAKHRQVIVFTHRISMVVGICEIAKKQAIKFTEVRISGRGQEKGVPISSAEYGGQVLTSVNKLLHENIARIKKLDIYDSQYDEQIHYVCQQMRIIVEKSVEDVLLNEVVKRFRRDIKTKGMIAKLADISIDDCNLIDDMMTKYSYYDHSMSDETPLKEFSIEDIESDANKLKDWIMQKRERK